MTEFQGIPIDEGLLSKLLLIEGVFVAFFFGLAVCILIFVISMTRNTIQEKQQNDKAIARIHKLQEKAATDPRAEKELARRLRKRQKSERQKRKDNAILYGSVSVLFVVVFVAIFALVIPKYQDRNCKDYVVYEGVYELSFGPKLIDWIVLPDGTYLEYYDDVDEEGERTGTIVYAPRSKLVLGVEKSARRSGTPAPTIPQ